MVNTIFRLPNITEELCLPYSSPGARIYYRWFDGRQIIRQYEEDNMSFIKICSICGREFKSHFMERLACSPGCAFQSILRGDISAVEDPIIRCLTCGTSFVPYSSQQKYCSHLCRKKGQKIKTAEILKRSCKTCQKEFQCNSNSQYYCTPKCRNIERNLRRRNKKI